MTGRRAIVVTLTGVCLLALPVSASTYEVAPVPHPGTLRGVVRFAGRAPRAESRPGEPAEEVCAEARPSQGLGVGPEGGVAGSVILIDGVARGKAPATAVVLLESRYCRLVARVTAVMAGERVAVLNDDPVLYRLRGLLGTRTVFDLALPHQGEAIEITRRLTTPGAVHVVSERHPRMTGWIVVHDSPYVAVTDLDGTYRIEGIPPGTYRVRMWHEGWAGARDRAPGNRRARTVARRVRIVPDATAMLDFALR